MKPVKLSITFLIRSLNYGGAERQLVTLAQALHRQGHEVVIAVFYGDGPLEKNLRETGIHLHSLKKGGRWDVLSFLWRLIRFIRSQKPDVLHSYLGISNILTALLKLVFPRIRMTWGVRASNMALERYDWTARVAYRVECWLSRFADLIIVNSHAGLDYAASNGFPKERMIVIPNGIDTERFKIDPAGRKKIRDEWDIGQDELLVGLVGRLDPMKDHLTFLKAAKGLAEGRDHLRFVCVGDGPASYRQELVTASEQYGLAGTLIWADSRDDMPDVYNAIDILVSSSSYGEGFSNVIGEGMACGVFCVVTDVGDSALIVGENGEVTPPADPEALGAAIARLCDNLVAGSLDRERNRRQIVDRFSVTQLETKTEAALLLLSQNLGSAC